MQALALSIKDVCKALNVTHPTVYKEIQAGRLQSFTIGRRRFVSPDALTNYVRAREKAGE
jgi:excisionase family DNA binding protein